MQLASNDGKSSQVINHHGHSQKERNELLEIKVWLKLLRFVKLACLAICMLVLSLSLSLYLLTSVAYLEFQSNSSDLSNYASARHRT
jgi:hypothetical protein